MKKTRVKKLTTKQAYDLYENAFAGFGEELEKAFINELEKLGIDYYSCKDLESAVMEYRIEVIKLAEGEYKEIVEELAYCAAQDISDEVEEFRDKLNDKLSKKYPILSL